MKDTRDPPLPAHDAASPRSRARTRSAAGARPKDSPPRVLLACNYDPANAATVCDHINAFARYSRGGVHVLSRVGDIFHGIDLDDFDVVVIHYSLALALDSYVSPRSRRALAAFKGVKAMFIQDEYRFVNATLAAIEACGIDVVFTCLAPPEARRVYGEVGGGRLRTEQVLTGYVPHWLLAYPPLPLASRPVMVGYRGRTYPAWHGEQGREKIRIGKLFKRDARRFGLHTDIAWSEASRLYGRDWLAFIRRCRAVLAVESGASVFDFDGGVAARSETFAALAERPGAIPAFKREVSYETLRERFFADREDQIDIAQISPRVFEAIALRTLVIAYPGRYSGVIEPWRHYIPLEKDHSNMAQVVEALRDVDKVAEIISNAYAEVALNPAYSYATMIEHFDRVTDELLPGRRRATGKRGDEELKAAFPFVLVDNPHGLPQASLARRGARKLIRMAGLTGIVRRLRR